MKLSQLFFEDKNRGNLVYVLLSLSFLSIMATGVISYFKVKESVSGLKKRINEDFELSSVKDIRSEYGNIDNMLEMYLITHNSFYLEQVDTSAKLARATINDLKLSKKLSPTSSVFVDSLKLYVNSKVKNIHQIVRFQQDASIEKLIEDYMNRESIRSAMDRASREYKPYKKSLLNNPVKKKQSIRSNTIPSIVDSTKDNLEKQDIVQMAEAGKINPYLEIDHDLNIKVNELTKTLESIEIDRLDAESRQTEQSIRSANNSILLLGAFTAIFIALAGLVYFRYIKKLSQIRKSLSDSKEIAEEMAMIKERFMANMSHEIRTPLNAISGFVDQLHASELNTKQKKQTHIIQKSIQHILNIINDILDFSKLNAGKLTLQSQGFEFEKTVRQTIELLETLVEENSVEIKLTLSEQFPEIIVGDAYRLRQILLNIIGNSIKYTNIGTIHVNIEHEIVAGNTCNIKICVKDTGIGIEKRELENIFKEFHMADNSRWNKAGSSGLGLSITKMLIELYQGNIQIESEINQGTTVCIQIPFQIGKSSDLVNENSYLDDLMFLENKTIIIADDEPFNRTLLSNILHKYNAKTFEAENGYHVLSILEKENVDCILMDIKMPEMNGLETTDKIRKNLSEKSSETPIIAISAALTHENLVSFKQLDVDLFLEKPFKESDLLYLLHKALKHESHNLTKIFNTGTEVQNTDQPYNLNQLKIQAGDDHQFMLEMIETLLDSTNKGIAEIENCIENSEWNEINIIAHRIASPLKFIQAIEVYKSIKQIEYITESGEDIPKEIIGVQFAAFKKQFENLEAILQSYLKNQPA